MEAASTLAQAMTSKSFEDGGYFDSLPLAERMALVELARTTVSELRAVDSVNRADHTEHDACTSPPSASPTPSWSSTRW